MNQSKKILAALVAIPATVVVAGEVQAAENDITKEEIFELKNDFIGNSNFTNQPSTNSFTLDKKANLENQILYEMANFTKGFTITYTGNDVDTYKDTIESVFANLKTSLNTTKSVIPASVDTATVFDVTEVYGTFNNLRVKATETRDSDKLISVKLEFSVNYFGDETELVAAKKQLIDFSSAGNDAAKIKAVHDYVINRTYYAAANHRLTPTSGLSSHAYALWTYMLLKQAFPASDVRYVYGVANGEYRSWNIVKLGGKWYHLDVAGDDTATRNSSLIKYRNFLTFTENERRIIYGSDSTIGTINDTTFNYFKTIENQAQSETHLYYADKETGGKIQRISLNNLTQETPGASGTLTIDSVKATTGAGRMVYYKQTTTDAAAVVPEYLYFINDSQGKYLYRYELLSNKLELLVKEQIQSIELAPPILGYTTTSNTMGTLPLNRMAELDQEKANNVIAKINELEAISNKTTTTFKADVVKVREMYTALTDDQRALVTNYVLLQKIENNLAVDIQTSTVIDLINALDEMKLDYVEKVDAAKLAYDRSNNKSAIYNKAILDAAFTKVEKARALKSDLDARIDSLGSNENAFEKIEDFIVFVENFLKVYDSFLPSIRSGVPGLDDIEDYRTKATQLRKDAQDFINEVKIIDENVNDFFESMDAIILKQNLLVASQKYLIRAEASIVTQKISLYETMKQEILTFKQQMATVVTSDTVNIDTIPLTQELISNAKAAQVLYNKMKQSQKSVVTTEFANLNRIMTRISAIEDNATLKALEAQLKTLDPARMTSLGAIASQYTTVDTAFVEVQRGLGNISRDELIAMLSPQAAANLELFRGLSVLVPDANELKSEMDRLDDTATPVHISDLRTKYNALNPLLTRFFIAELAKLVEQEKRLQDIASSAAVQDLIDEIELLTEESGIVKVREVKARYDRLSSTLQALVINKETLLTLWDKLSKEEATYQKAINDVITMIDKLNDKSMLTDVEAAQEAYDGLLPEQQALVTNYDRISEIMALIEARDADAIALAEAQKVENLIHELTDESTFEQIQEARDAYNNLSERALKLLNSNVLRILESFEARLDELRKQAQEEAAVVVTRIDRITNNYTVLQINSIRIAYNALSSLAKFYVTNYQKLINAESNIIYQNTVVKQAKQDAAAFDAYMENVTRNSTTSEIAAARALYNRLSYEAKKHVETYTKLVRLETMWKDPEYLELVYTYYPDYINAIKPGGIEIKKPEYDSLYIPDDSESKSVANYLPSEATWATYEDMTYQNGRYTTKITSTQVKNLSDRTLTLKAGDMEVVLPVADLKEASGTVGVTLSVSNQQLNIQLTEGSTTKAFSEYVEVRVPMSKLNGNKDKRIERVVSGVTSPASFKVEDASFVIRTKTSGTFKVAKTTVTYNDLGTSSAGKAIAELAKRGITYNTTTTRFVNISKTVSRADVATLIGDALDLSSTSKTKYKDLGTSLSSSRAQGLLDSGIMSGETSTNFGVHSNVTKQQAAIIIANMYRYLNQDLSMAYNDLQTNYTDVSALTYEARQSIAILELFGVADGYGKFNPNATLTRGEFAELLYKSLKAIDFL